jgi:WD40 repeat protein
LFYQRILLAISLILLLTACTDALRTSNPVYHPAPSPSMPPSGQRPTVHSTAVVQPTAEPTPNLPTPTVTESDSAVAPPAAAAVNIDETTLATLQRLHTIGLGGAIAAAIAPDNTRLAIATTAGLALFELPSLRQLRLDTIPGGAEQVSFADEGQTLRVVTGRRYGPATVQLRRVADGSLVEVMAEDESTPFSPVINSPDGQLEAQFPPLDSVQIPGVRVTRTSDGALLYEDESTLTIAFSPDSSLIALVASDGAVRVLDRSGTAIGELALPPYWGVGFSPDGNTLVAAGRSIDLWDAATATRRAELDALLVGRPSSAELRVRPSADGSVLTVEGGYQFFESVLRQGSAWYVTGETFTPAWRSSASGAGIGTFQTYVGAISSATDATAWTEDGIALGIYSAGELQRTIQVPSEVGALAFSPDGTLLAIGDRAGRVQLVPVADGAPTQEFQATGSVTQLEFASDGAMLGARSESGEIVVWQLDTDRRVALITEPAELRPLADRPWAEPFLFTPDSEILIAWGRNGVRFYRLNDGALVHLLPERTEAVAIDPQGHILALLQDELIALWGLPSAE